MNVSEITNTIIELENGDTTFASCEKLASLYIVRDHLSTDEVITEYNDIPYQKLQKTIEDITDDSVIFIDSREKADIERLVNDYHAKTILITNSLKDKITYGNHADDNVNDYNYDIYIDNCGSLDELKEKAINFYKNNIV